MKKQYVIKVCSMAFLLFGPYLLHAQQTVSSGGGDLAASNVKLAFTIGEIAVKTHANTDFRIEEGTQHNTSIIINEIEEHESMFNVDVFPNPTTYYLNLNITSNDPEFSGFNWTLSNVTGKKYASANGLQKGTHRLALYNLPSGIYFLKVCDDQQTTSSIHKIQITK